MTIGKALKQIRLSLNLTQEEMAAGVVNRSFYSRIESDKNDVNAKDLIFILKKHHVSVVNFFKPLGEKNAPNEIVEAMIEDAVDQKDSSKLEEIKKETKNQRFQFLLDHLLHQLEPKNYPALVNPRKLMLIPEAELWNEDFLWLFSLIFDLYNFSDLQNICKTIFSHYYKETISRERTAELLAKVTVLYMRECLKTKNKLEFKKAKDFFNWLPNFHSLSFWKIKVIYLQAEFNDDLTDVRKIGKVMNELGYNF